MDEAALRWVVDELAIRTLFLHYGHYLDAGNGEGYASLFTEDGSYTRANRSPPELGGSGLPAESYVGRENLTKAAKFVSLDHWAGGIKHQMTDLVIEPGDTPDTARGYSRALLTDWRSGAGKLAMCATYTTDFVRTKAGWKIKTTYCELIPTG
jgi:hypothetical protein